MLLGEHAVLHGHKALVCAINRRIMVSLFPLPDAVVRIDSDLGRYESALDHLEDHPQFRFVLQAIRQHADQLDAGFKLKIESEFSADIGFGSSAAVTVAVHAALLRRLHGETPSRNTLFSQALETIQTVQGRGSGADVAASVFGGVVGYTTRPEFEPLEISMPITAVYSGRKTPTPEVIRHVDALRTANPEKYERIYAAIDSCVDEAISALRRKDYSAFGVQLNHNQILMDEMGVNTPELQEIVSVLHQEPEVFGAKISGSGLGDCAVAFGYAHADGLDYPVYHLEIEPEGFLYHE